MGIMHQAFSCQRDDLTIRGKLYRPEGENLPVVIISHGFVGCYHHVEHYAIALAEAGCTTLCYDFCGGSFNGESDGESTNMSVLTEKQDLLAVVRYVMTLPYIDPARIYLMGCSQGGFVSGLAAAELKERIAGLIMFYPALCIPDDARKGSMLMATFDPENIPETIACGPHFTLGRRYPADVIKMDPYEEIIPYPGPVLIVHGTADPVVNVSYAKEAYKAFSKRTGSTPTGHSQLLVLPDASHGFLPAEDDLALFAVGQFMQGRAEVLTIDVQLIIHWAELRDDVVVKHLPFKGTSDSPFFKGTILPGAEDEQHYKNGKPVSFCATYTIEGTDYAGVPCKMNIKNTNQGGQWKPAVDTDSEALAFLNDAACVAYLEHRRVGPVVHIYAHVPNI